jgi:hypothetical protein
MCEAKLLPKSKADSGSASEKRSSRPAGDYCRGHRSTCGRIRIPVLASPFRRRLANASGRIEFNIVLFMDWSFASGCSPPRLSTTQLPSATDRPMFPSDRDFHPTIDAYSQAHSYRPCGAKNIPTALNFTPFGIRTLGLVIVLAEPFYNSGPNFTVSSPIDKFPWAPMRPDIGCPGNRTTILKVSDDQKRMIIQHHQ